MKIFCFPPFCASPVASRLARMRTRIMICFLFVITTLFGACVPEFESEDLFPGLFHYTATIPALASPRATRTPTTTATPRFTLTPTVAPTVTATPHPIVTPTYGVVEIDTLNLSASDAFRLVKDVTVPDGETIERDTIVLKSWRITNSGSTVWNDGYRLIRKDPTALDAPQSAKAIFLQPTDLIELQLGTWNARQFAVAPQSTVDLVLPIRIPPEPGAHRIEYDLVNDKNELVQPKLWIEFNVPYSQNEQTATADAQALESALLTETPDLSAEPERYPLGTQIAVSHVQPVDWNGKWLIRDPFDQSELVPLEAFFSQDEEIMTGYFYDRSGEPVLIQGTLSSDRQTFTGTLGYAWERSFITVKWQMHLNREQFSSEMPGGLIDFGASCGGRDGAGFPDYCALPPGA